MAPEPICAIGSQVPETTILGEDAQYPKKKIPLDKKRRVLFPDSFIYTNQSFNTSACCSRTMILSLIRASRF